MLCGGFPIIYRIRIFCVLLVVSAFLFVFGVPVPSLLNLVPCHLRLGWRDQHGRKNETIIGYGKIDPTRLHTLSEPFVGIYVPRGTTRLSGTVGVRPAWDDLNGIPLTREWECGRVPAMYVYDVSATTIQNDAGNAVIDAVTVTNPNTNSIDPATWVERMGDYVQRIADGMSVRAMLIELEANEPHLT